MLYEVTARVPEIYAHLLRQMSGGWQVECRLEFIFMYARLYVRR